MSKISALIIFFLTIAIFTGPVVAKKGDGETPAEESVCDVLKVNGITPGLYGLCVAYCEAEASSDMVLRNYESKATGENDPPMPCLETATVCPCWGSDRLAAASMVADPANCFITPGFSQANYASATTTVQFFAADFGEAGFLCGYNGPDGFESKPATQDEDAICQEGIAALIELDFGGSCP